MSHVMILGLDHDLAEQLAAVLRTLNHSVRISTAVTDTAADVVFCSGDLPDYSDTLGVLRRSSRGPAVVVVNRHPDHRLWLDALEMGADDYCGAPFEPQMVGWLMDSVSRRVRAAAA